MANEIRANVWRTTWTKLSVIQIELAIRSRNHIIRSINSDESKLFDCIERESERSKLMIHDLWHGKGFHYSQLQTNGTSMASEWESILGLVIKTHELRRDWFWLEFVVEFDSISSFRLMTSTIRTTSVLE